MNTRTSKDIWLSVYSDTYKDLNGFRPRGEWLRTATADELKDATTRLQATLTAVLEEEQKAAEFAAALANNEPLSGNGWAYTPAN